MSSFLGTLIAPHVATLPVTGTPGQIVSVGVAGTLNVWQNGGWVALAAASLGSSIGGSGVADFGTGALVASVDVADARALLTHNVIASISLNMPAGIAADELEMDPIKVAAHVPVAGTVRLRAYVDGPAKVRGGRTISYTLV